MPGVIHFPSPATPTTFQPRHRFGSLRAIFALMLREMSTSYGRSPGGYVWAILEPAGAIALLTVIFAIGFHAPPIGHDFALFYATGLLPFMMFNHTSATVANAINYSKPLLAYPSVTYIDAICARFLLNLMTQILVMIIIMLSLNWIIAEPIRFDPMRVISAVTLIASLSLGIGTLNCFLSSMFPLWQRIWSVMTRPLFLISGIIFILEIVPQPYRDYLWYNPLIHVVSLMRSGFYASYAPTWVNPVFIMLISSVCFVLGLVFLNRYHREILQN